jgi:hypothetical protein
LVSHIHRKKPKGRAMPETMLRANNAKSKIRARVEHLFAEQKDRMELFIRTIGIAQAMTKIGTANLVYNNQTPYLPQSGPLISIPNSNQAKSTAGVMSADLQHEKNNSLIEPSRFVQPLQFDRQHAVAIVRSQHFGCVLVQDLVHVLDRAAMVARNGLCWSRR